MNPLGTPGALAETKPLLMLPEPGTMDPMKPCGRSCPVNGILRNLLTL